MTWHTPLDEALHALEAPLLERLGSTPPIPLEDSAADTDLQAVVIQAESSYEAQRRFSFRRLMQFMGPGILMSIAYVDPGNLESDLQTGAKTGYTLLWLLLASTVMGFIVQMQSAKLGVVTGKHLAQHCRERYPAVPRYTLWLMAEVAIIGSDIQEVIGSAIALSILTGGRLPLWGGVLLTAADSFALLFIERLGIRMLEAFFGLLVGIMVVTFGIMYVKADVPVSEVVHGFTVPALPEAYIPTAVALMGSLIMPHNIYLHSALVQTRKLPTGCPGAKREALMYFSVESALSLGAAVVINLFVVAVFSAGFFGKEVGDIGLQNAGAYLGATYGPLVVVVWALGLLAAGQSSTMTGTYTGQFVMSGYLNLKVSPWARIAITRAVAIVPTLAVALAYRSSKGGELDVLNQGLNLLQSIQLPFALVPVLTFTSSRQLMGEFTNSRLLSAVTWAIAGVVALINLTAVYEVASEAMFASRWTALVITAGMTLYFCFVTYLIIGPQRWAAWLASTGGCACCKAAAASSSGFGGAGASKHHHQNGLMHPEHGDGGSNSGSSGGSNRGCCGARAAAVQAKACKAGSCGKGACSSKVGNGHHVYVPLPAGEEGGGGSSSSGTDAPRVMDITDHGSDGPEGLQCQHQQQQHQ